MGAPHGLEWTDERVDMLKKLYADGLSCSQIACELTGITRNAVIGKVNRLGLSGRAKRPSSVSPRPRKPKRENQYSSRANKIAWRAGDAAYDFDVEPEQELIEIPVEQRKNLLQLTGKTCHWPVGDPHSTEFYFCGGDASAGPYCAFHSRIAYQPMTDRRRDRRPFRD